MTGDSRLVSVNPIRDTLFASNPDLYYLIGNVLTIAASLILTGGMAANAAVSAGTSIGRAVVTEYAKQGLTVAASSYVDKRMTEATNSPLAGFVVGSLTGMATYGTLSELDSMANVSGLHSSFAEGMSKEDAQKYLDFLENGSKEGLTEAEIRGIGKVDEALALKKVNPEELLELRKQQLGNVGESGSNTGTVWDNITGTADNMPATEIPATFKIDLDGKINYVNTETGTNTLWTNSNATKHMGEYVSRFGDESWSIGTRSQAMLESYSASLNKAMETIGTEASGRYFGTYGNWELGINTETGVVYHARMLN